MKTSCITAELLPKNLVNIVEKVENQQRISEKEAKTMRITSNPS